ncbi:dihydrofolate reductase [Beggiatoa alba B18LD]|uniref:Dihydrofolate reductase n=1 Tax=Beggiatoa alba B18LD TaxID=395493 RepID=I3CGD7_9GAMM|nr:dihydrofolate reductase family protein [Beggiatoa alba]EIJ42680.1 dihydrofolate reductase [Beggiatoa alba B18LD]
MQRQLVLYIASSLDGYIAKPNDDLSFLSLVEQAGEDYGYQTFIDSVDTIILGRKTYDWVMKQVTIFPHHDKTTYVITHQVRSSEGNLHFYTGNLRTLIQQLKAEQGKNIFCDGGAEIVNLLLQEQLFDRLIISIIPVLVGEGIKLFKTGIPEKRLKLLAAKSFTTGLVQLHYHVEP